MGSYTPSTFDRELLLTEDFKPAEFVASKPVLRSAYILSVIASKSSLSYLYVHASRDSILRHIDIS